jgi:hypothetical protein
MLANAAVPMLRKVAGARKLALVFTAARSTMAAARQVQPGKMGWGC